MKKDSIGIIVPVYKAEKYITKCIESILAQTYTNFRLILVDDGTPDNAGKICDDYAKKDPRITVIHQDNAGVTRARARGVEEAAGCEFITFVDSDDTIIPNALYQLRNAMADDTDIVISHVAGYNYPNVLYIEKEEYLHYLISGHTLSCAPWGKLFRNALFSDWIFDIPHQIVYGEDLLMNIRLGFKSNKGIVVLNKIIYRYYINQNGCDRTFKTSPDYENLFLEHLLYSIPSIELNKYYKDTIEKRVSILKSLIGYKYIPNKEWIDSEFHKRLMSDIKTFNFKIRLIELTTIKYINFFIRVLPVCIQKLQYQRKKLFKLFTNK